MKTNYELYGRAVHALQVFEAQSATAHMTWAFAAWLDLTGADDCSPEGRINYLRACEGAHILSAVGHKELKKLGSERRGWRSDL